jgi:putative transposase
LTYEGAFHHGMNRGINGENIIEGDQNKASFLGFLEDAALRYRIRILAYCIMNNHYHLIIQNTSGKLSDFFRHLNGSYGMYYRKSVGGVGYVFQKRFKSTLIQKEEYLVQAIVIRLSTPLTRWMAKICQ